MTQTKIMSEVRVVSDVLYSGRFEVPWHQRNYDWTVEQVNELLNDLKDALTTGKTCYFLGSIMLVNSQSEQSRQINDGQQRLITLSLLIAALCRRFAGGRRDGDRETLALRALFDRSDNEISKLQDTSKYDLRIRPPRNDSSKYGHMLRGNDVGANGLLTSAWNAIGTFVDRMDRTTRHKFFDFLMQKTEIAILNVPRDVDANLVFEALNARGKPLDDVDLIRNRLYSYFSESDDGARLETVHQDLENVAVILRNRAAVQEYYRCYLQCRYGYLQKKRLYREARLQIENIAGRKKQSDHVFDLVAGLGQKNSIELFRMIRASGAKESLDQRLPATSGKRNLTTLLNELQGYKVSYLLVFALLSRFIAITDNTLQRKAGQIVTRSIKNLASFVMRTAFVAPKFESSRFEEAFANCAKVVFNGTDLDSLDIYESLKKNDDLNVMSDSNFIRHMTNAELHDNKKALRYLFGINEMNQAGSDAIRADRCSVEHILPQSEMHWNDWTEFQDVDAKDWIYRTGNQIVVSSKENRPGVDFNRSFLAKKRAFENSSLQMARDIAKTYNKWTPKIVEDRSMELAKDAARVWRFTPAKPK